MTSGHSAATELRSACIGLLNCSIRFDAFVELIESVLQVEIRAVVDGPGEVTEKQFDVKPNACDHGHAIGLGYGIESSLDLGEGVAMIADQITIRS